MPSTFWGRQVPGKTSLGPLQESKVQFIWQISGCCHFSLCSCRSFLRVKGLATLCFLSFSVLKLLEEKFGLALQEEFVLKDAFTRLGP